MEQIVVEQQQTVFGMDSLTTSKALSSHVDSSASISAHFDSISYNKGNMTYKINQYKFYITFLLYLQEHLLLE